ALDDGHDLDAVAATEPRRQARRQRPRAEREAEVGAPEPPLAHQRADDLAGGRVDRHRQAQAHTRHGRVDADHAAASVRQRAAGGTAGPDSGSAPTTVKSTSRPSTNDARPRESVRATTCAEVSMKPSGVITTALPPPSTRRPPRARRETRRLATEGASRSATPTTVREYESSGSSSGCSGPRIASACVSPIRAKVARALEPASCRFPSRPFVVMLNPTEGGTPCSTCS